MYTDVQIRFGQEVLCLDSWCRRRQYDAMCQALGSGLNLHLAENELLRDVFQLGPKLIVGDLNALKQSKLERVSRRLTESISVPQLWSADTGSQSR